LLKIENSEIELDLLFLENKMKLLVVTKLEFQSKLRGGFLASEKPVKATRGGRWALPGFIKSHSTQKWLEKI